MKTLKFKTTIKCSGCVAKATPFLNEAVGEDNWKVDVQSLDKVLSIATEKPGAEAEIIKVIKEAGFKAETID
jgi:copper chaperone